MQNHSPFHQDLRTAIGNGLSQSLTIGTIKPVEKKKNIDAWLRQQLVALESEYVLVRDNNMRTSFGTVVVTETMIKKNEQYRRLKKQHDAQFQEQKQLLTKAAQFMEMGVDLAEHWITFVPDPQVQVYLEWASSNSVVEVSNNSSVMLIEDGSGM